MSNDNEATNTTLGRTGHRAHAGPESSAVPSRAVRASIASPCSLVYAGLPYVGSSDWTAPPHALVAPRNDVVGRERPVPRGMPLTSELGMQRSERGEGARDPAGAKRAVTPPTGALHDSHLPRMSRILAASPPHSSGCSPDHVARTKIAILRGVPLPCDPWITRLERVRRGDHTSDARRASSPAKSAIVDESRPFMRRICCAPPPHLAC